MASFSLVRPLPIMPESIGGCWKRFRNGGSPLRWNWNSSYPGFRTAFPASIGCREHFQFLDFGFPFPAALLLRPLELTVRTTLVKHAVAARKLIPLLDSVQRFPLENGWIPFLRHLEGQHSPRNRLGCAESDKGSGAFLCESGFSESTDDPQLCKIPLCKKSCGDGDCSETLQVSAWSVSGNDACPPSGNSENASTGTPIPESRLSIASKTGEFSLISGNPLIRLHSKAEY